MLVRTEELPGGALIYAVEDGDGGNPWSTGLCGSVATPEPVMRVSRRFVRRADDLHRTQAEGTFLVESILTFSPGGSIGFMQALRDSAAACQLELQASGRALFGGEKQFPLIRNESQVYSIERFGCCATPLATDAFEPHDIVYIRDGDLVLHLYGTDATIEFASRVLENHIDGLPNPTQ